MCSAINAIDASALESVEAINHRLKDSGVSLHLSEVKGPVMDALERSHLLHDLTGKVWLSQNEAFDAVIAIANRDEEAQQPPDLWMARELI
jgi:SulP family sulfate permease